MYICGCFLRCMYICRYFLRPVYIYIDAFQDLYINVAISQSLSMYVAVSQDLYICRCSHDLWSVYTCNCFPWSVYVCSFFPRSMCMCNIQMFLSPFLIRRKTFCICSLYSIMFSEYQSTPISQRFVCLLPSRLFPSLSLSSYPLFCPCFTFLVLR